MNIEKASFITADQRRNECADGSWDAAIITLIIFMAADWITGLTVAGVLRDRRSRKRASLKAGSG